ncbi:radical SAM protein [bacterium]|nr:radical SAM protein [bacterium]
MNDFLRDIGFYFSRQICYPFVSPDVLQISVTNRCNLQCTSCNVWRQDNSDSELGLSDIKDILDESAKWGIKEVHLLGGEPLLREDWPEIAKYVKKKELSLVICTNGTLINENMVAKIIECRVDILSVSLDGAKEKTHDSLRGQKGAYNKILRGINLLNEFDNSIRPKVVLILTVSKKNLLELKEYIDLAYSLSAYGIYFTALTLDNVQLFSQKKTHDLWIEKEYFKDLDKIFQEIYDYGKSKGYCFDYPSFKSFADYFRGDLQKRDWVCFAGLKRLVVIPTGDIQVCGEVVGNYKAARSLKKIWSSPRAVKRRWFVKNCRNYCLQDCHARPESNSFLEIAKRVCSKVKKGRMNG